MQECVWHLCMRLGVRSVVSRPRFGCYSPVRTGSAGQAPGGKVARKVERTYIDVLFPLGSVVGPIGH
jgi:hypothetical protein